MKFIETEMPGVWRLEPKVFGDARGFFLETFREDLHRHSLPTTRFVQDNHSRSARGVLRGLHYQVQQPQAKLVRVSRGRIFDVAVDLRPGSPRFGQWIGMILDDEQHHQAYIPEGFAHGFCVLSDIADVHYRCSDYYRPDDEAGIAWNDPSVGIVWPDMGVAPLLSAKDQAWPALAAQTRLPLARAWG